MRWKVLGIEENDKESQICFMVASMQAMQVVEVENDLSGAQKWLKSNNKNNDSYEEIHNEYSI